MPLYRDPPDGELYSTWIEGGSIQQTLAWSDAVKQDKRADSPDVPDLALRIPYLAAVYGRMLPVGASWQLDCHLDTGQLPVQWAPGGPVAMVPATQLVPFADGAPDAGPAGPGRDRLLRPGPVPHCRRAAAGRRGEDPQDLRRAGPLRPWLPGHWEHLQPAGVPRAGVGPGIPARGRAARQQGRPARPDLQPLRREDPGRPGRPGHGRRRHQRDRRRQRRPPPPPTT